MKQLLIQSKAKILCYLLTKNWFITLNDWIDHNKEFIRRNKQQKIFNEIALTSQKIEEIITEQPIITDLKENKLPFTSQLKSIKIGNDILEWESNNIKNIIYIPFKEERKIKQKPVLKVKKTRPIKWTKNNIVKMWEREMGVNNNSNTIE